MTKKLTVQDLSADQLSALNKMIEWYHSLDGKALPFILTGAAGTGKTSILPVMIDELKLKRLNMIGLATSAIAAKNIGQKAGIIDVRTIASFLKAPQPQLLIHRGKQTLAMRSIDDLQKYINQWPSISPAQRTQVNHIFQKAKSFKPHTQKPTKQNQKDAESAMNLLQLQSLDVKALNQVLHQTRMFELSTSFIDRQDSLNKNAIERLQGLDLLVVDELSMIPGVDIEMLLKIASMAHVPIILIGDPFQLPPVKAQPHKLLTDKKYPWRVTLMNLHRQSNLIAKLGSFLRPPYQFTLGQALQHLDASSSGPINEIGIANHNQIEQARKSGSLVKLLNASDMVLARTNRQVKSATMLMRADRYNASRLEMLDDKLRVHDKIRISMNEFMSAKSDAVIQPNERFMNGMLGEIVAIHNDRATFYDLDRIDHISALIYQQLHLKCVDIKLENGQIRKNLFVNSLSISDPNINASTLYGGNLYHIAGMTNKAPYFYQWFNTNILQYEKSLFYDDKFHHMSILYISFGYVLTVYKSQGREWDNVTYICKTPIGDANTRRKLNYTAITRAKTRLNLLVDDLS